MSRIKLLQSQEIKEFETPPLFTYDQKVYFFTIPIEFQAEYDSLRQPYTKIGFVAQLGYFRNQGRFYDVKNFHKEDIAYISKQYKLRDNRLNLLKEYSNQSIQQHRQKILQVSNWRSFEEAKSEFQHQIERLIERQLLPRKVLIEVKEYLFRQRIEAPSYDSYLRIINETLIKVGKAINHSLEQQLTADHKEILDEFLKKQQGSQRADIVKYKTINQSDRPRDIETSLAQFKELKNRMDALGAPIKSLNLSDAMIDYHAYWTIISEADKIQDHSDKYLFLLSFLIYQVRKRQDFFIDLFLQSVRAAFNYTKRLQKENYFQDQNQRKVATKLLVNSQRNYRDQLQAVKAIVKSGYSDQEKILALEELLEEDISPTKDQQQLIESIAKEISQDAKTEFYNSWERRSIWLSNRIGKILIHLIFSGEDTDKALFDAVQHYAAHNGRLSYPSKNLSWLDPKEQDFLYDVDINGKEKFRSRLYKMFLFQSIEAGIKSGIVNFNHSYRYRCLEEYLIDKQEWLTNKKQWVIDSELQGFADYKSVINGLEEHLDDLYHQANGKIISKGNPHLSFNRLNKPIIDTPSVEKPDLERVSSYFRPARYVSILSVLSDIERCAPFLQLFGHQSKIDEKKRPTPETFFAAIIAMGCNIGVDRMGQISKGIQLSTLKHTSDWYLTPQALQDANNTIIKVKNDLALPEIHRKDPQGLHTVSDGQKILVKRDSFNATYSAKYPGFTKASSINTAIDERFATYYSTVITAADREAGNVVDIHLGNPVIKSTIHSTDSHGGTEVVFGMMHFFGIFFAPRIKDLGSLELYGFASKKKYVQFDYKLLPDHYINEKLIEDNWDDMLRLLVSIKSGKTTAFQILKRLNSYAKQNPLQRAFKEFGRIIRTAFILRYYNDLDLRQSVEKQLSHIEMMNRFAKAVFFGNNQEFTVATKQEQEKIILCRRLIQNSIVLWNYMYLSDLLAKTETQYALKEMINVIKNGTAVTWQHINLMGEYDFNILLNNPKSRFDIQSILEWKYDSVA